MDEWLRSKGFARTLRPPADAQRLDSLSVETLLKLIHEIKAAWNLPLETVRDLRFFVPQGCRLFDTNFTQYLDRDRNRASLHHLTEEDRAETVGRLTRDAIKALNNIIQGEELPLSSLAQGDIRGMMRALRSGGGKNDSILKVSTHSPVDCSTATNCIQQRVQQTTSPPSL